MSAAQKSIKIRKKKQVKFHFGFLLNDILFYLWDYLKQQVQLEL